MVIQFQEKLVSDEIRRLVPVLGRETAQRIAKAYLLGDEKARLRILELIDVVKAATFADSGMRPTILLEPPSAGELTGTISLGSVLYGDREMGPLTMEPGQFLMHTGIFGSSGYGKTNISHTMIMQLAERQVPVIIFDFSKMNYRDLLQTHLRDQIDVYTIGKDTAPFPFNPLVGPAGVSPTQWAKEFASIFDHAFWLLGGGRHVVLRALHKLYQTNKRPTMHELREVMIDYSKAVTSREKNWISTAERPLESLCMSELGEMLGVREGRTPAEFLVPGRITILELDALSDNDKAFFIEIILQWLRDFLLVKNSKEKLLGVVILEEAHHVLNREKTKKMGTETVMDLVFREVRELGLGIVYLDQHPSLVSYPALGNTSTHIYLNLGLDTKYSSDIQDASSMLGLDFREDGAHLRRLPVGQGFVLMRSGGFPYPFLAKFPRTPITKGTIMEADVERHMKTRLLEHPVALATPVLPHEPLPQLEEKELKVLRAVGFGKGITASQLYKHLRMSGSTFSDTMKQLVTKQVIGMKSVKLKHTKAHFYYLTGIGDALFQNHWGPLRLLEDLNQPALEDGFRRLGYTVAASEGSLTVTKQDSTIPIRLVDALDRAELRKMVQESEYFICASQHLACALIQEAARFAKEAGTTKTLHVATQDLRRGFEKVEL